MPDFDAREVKRKQVVITFYQATDQENVLSITDEGLDDFLTQLDHIKV